MAANPILRSVRRVIVLVAGAVVLIAGLIVWLERGSGAGGHADHLIDTRRATIGGVRARTTRAAAEMLLGRGTRVSRRFVRSPGQGHWVEQVSYPGAGMVVTYIEVAHPPRSLVAAVLTRDRRYRTADGLGVGTSVARLRREASLTCGNLSPETGSIQCSRGGYHQPVTAFDAQNGAVVWVMAVSSAD